MKRRLLLNYVYYTPIGHVLEALKFANTFYKSNKDLEISVALSSASPYALAHGCKAINKVYPVDLDELLEYGEKAKSVLRIPKNWDYIITNDIIRHQISGKPGWMEGAFFRYLDVANKRFHARIAKGTCYWENNFPKPLKYRKTRLTLEVPNKAKRFVKRYDHNGLKICILPAGSGGSAYYPSSESWIAIIKALNNEFNGSRIYITGITRETKHGATSTRSFGSDDIDTIACKFDNVTNCLDIGLWNQVALVEMCDVLIAPHSGFAFLGSCVGTPWLALSGGDWSEYFFNHFPFYSVLPNDPDFPYEGKGRHSKHVGTGWGKNAVRESSIILPFRYQSIKKKIPEIMEGTRLLLNKNFTYKKAINIYKENIKKSVCRKDKLRTYESF